jgi:4-amino-4-deoxy-L-arabinose transferase-like glycosyltransferase
VKHHAHAPGSGQLFGHPLLLLALLAILPLLPTLDDPLFADDYLHVERIAELDIGSPGQAARSWILHTGDTGAWWSDPELRVPYFRPIVSVSFWLDHALWGLRPFGYHLTNLLLHLAATLLAYGVARRLLGVGPAAWGAAAIFALHPCHTEAIAWVSGRTDLLSSVSYLAAAALCLEARERGGGRWPWIAAALAAFGLALLAKEMAVTLPAVLVLDAWLRPAREPLGRRLAPALAALGVVVAYLALRTAVLGQPAPPPHPFVHRPGDPDFLQHLLAAPLLYLADLVLFVPPDPVVTAPFWAAQPLLLALFSAVVLLLFTGSIRAVREARVRLWALGWMGLTLVPVLPVSVGERFLYLPSFGYCLLLAARLPATWAAWTAADRRALRAVLVLLGLVFLGKNLAFGWVSAGSRQAVEDALAAVDASPGATQLLVVDLPAASALAFAHAVRVERPRRSVTVEILSIAPPFLDESAAVRSELVWEGPDAFVLARRDALFLTSYIERAYLAERTPPAEGELITRPGYVVEILRAPAPRVQSFRVRLRTPALLLRGEGFRLQPVPPHEATAPG